MKPSDRVKNIQESVTLKLASKAVELKSRGGEIYNLAGGQLPFPPPDGFKKQLAKNLDFVNSFQYTPVAGDTDLRAKLVAHFRHSRQIEKDVNCVVSNGAKQSLSNIFECFANPGDEIVFPSPFWTSYPEMVKLTGAKFVKVDSGFDQNFVPNIEDICSKITGKTKFVVINSPNNPSGICYSSQWMEEFARRMVDFPDVHLISDEIYDGLVYRGAEPTYFYQHNPELLERTIIVNGISKVLGATGLRLGYAIAQNDVVKTIASFQGQTTSCANSLTQMAFLNFDFRQIPGYLEDVKQHIAGNAGRLKNAFQKHGLESMWYQPSSAFYFLLDFSKAPVVKNYPGEESSFAICRDLLEEHNLALIPGAAFGAPNTARMTLLLKAPEFEQACERLFEFLLKGNLE